MLLMDSGLGSVPFQAFNFPLMKSCLGVAVLQYTSVMLILLYTSLRFFLKFILSVIHQPKKETKHVIDVHVLMMVLQVLHGLRYSFTTLS